MKPEHLLPLSKKMFSQSHDTQHSSRIITHIADTINNTNVIVLLICVWIYMLPTLLLPQTEQHRSPCTLISWGTSWTSVQSSWGTASARRCSPRSLSRTGQCSRSPTRSCQGATMRSSPSRWRRPCSELHCESDAVTVIQHSRICSFGGSFPPYGTLQGKKVGVVKLYPGVVLQSFLEWEVLVVGFVDA